ncbi:hypothetical protein BK131_03340 [Paenibacillus amylolyticus]|uniref:DUF5348 domain-containing protein n=1 Tax=Paenibacillus amylolyticus TaxID=1451 RepID=A0A1R1C4G2_PAEAM|nr:DUF5348 domain-containing protein [Paenibacillus amylolyticus]OMF17022.1 hypothetical protein BK131_03340 [Paenibacillus amylolyticus]
MKESVKKYQIQAELEELLPRMQRVFKQIKDMEDEWSNHYDRNDPEEQYQRGMFYKAGDLMDDAARVLTQAFAEVRDEGHVYLQSNGRYELNGTELFSGSPIEFLAVDADPPRWVATHIEHYDGDYRLVNHREVPLDGLHVRNK